MVTRAEAAVATFLGVLLAISLSGLAFRVGPSSFHLEQAPGTEETYTLAVTDDTDHAEEIQLYLGDWLRAPNGEHDWDIPLDGARFTLDRSFAAGETVRVRYTVVLPAGRDLQVAGGFVAEDPRLTGTISGPGILSLTGGSGGEEVQSDSGISVVSKGGRRRLSRRRDRRPRGRGTGPFYRHQALREVLPARRGGKPR